MMTENWWKKIIFCFLLNFITCFSTSCDVFELVDGGTPVAFLNAAQFEAFIRANSDTLPGGAINPFVDDAANATQMLGYAMFFPEGKNTDPQQVYVAKKRVYADGSAYITNYESATSIEDFRNSTNFDHTER